MSIDLTLISTSGREDVSYQEGRIKRERLLSGLFHIYVTDHPLWGDGFLYRDASIVFYNIERTISCGAVGYISADLKPKYTTPRKNKNSWDGTVFGKIFCSDRFYDYISVAAERLSHNRSCSDPFILSMSCNIEKNTTISNNHAVLAFSEFLFPNAADDKPVGTSGIMRHYPGHVYKLRGDYQINEISNLELYARSTVKRTDLGLIRHQLSKMKNLPESENMKHECHYYNHLFYEYRYALYIKDDDEVNDEMVANNV